jgi:hypothetical protein
MSPIYATLKQTAFVYFFTLLLPPYTRHAFNIMYADQQWDTRMGGYCWAVLCWVNSRLEASVQSDYGQSVTARNCQDEGEFEHWIVDKFNNGEKKC